jgi:hypothetical protein
MQLRRWPRLVPHEIAHSRRAASSGNEVRKALSMTALNHPVYDKATPEGLQQGAESAPMPEKLVRLERLLAVLDAREVPTKERGRYLMNKVGSGQQGYWSNLVNGSKSFGREKARQIELALELANFTLEEHGLAPDAASIAGKFDRLPTDTPEALALRKQLYKSIMAMIQAHDQAAPSEPAPAIGQRPSSPPLPSA